MKKYFIVLLCMLICLSALPVCAESSDNFIVKVESKTAKAGEKVELKVELINNPGVLAMLFVLDYDSEKLKLTGATDGKLLEGGLFGNDFSANPFKLLWNSASSKNFTEDGTLVTLEFEVLSEAPVGFSEVTLGYKQKNIYDVDLNDVELTVENGGITIEANVPPSGGGASGGGGYSPTVKPSKKPEKEPDYVVELMNFSDVSEKDWFYEGVKYAYDNKLMKGVSESEFSPETTLTRGMFVTVLHRLANEPEAGGHGFSDVPENSWFSDAVSWASNNGIVAGVSEKEFSPDKEITREQMAAIIYRFAKYVNADLTAGENTNILSYDDFSSVSEYAVTAFQYACGKGIINGTTVSTLSPKANATRAQAAAVFMRISELFK